LRVSGKQQPNGLPAGSLDDQRARITGVAECLVILAADDDLAAE
jgi:hypothetical protein